ncbi:MAG TPA: CoA-transferase [Kofleriaceae bacterium]|jgi:acyl CoA:acetate/3-ketoacid CoA transferase alpha subunit
MSEVVVTGIAPLLTRRSAGSGIRRTPWPHLCGGPASPVVAHGPLVTRLADAIAAHVEPGMHLHFASTPSRSNAAIRELARAFLGTRPGFRLSSTGFHSMAHLLPMLGLAARLTACFFGDHYPAPRPNLLYTRLAAEGVAIEHWALWTMVASLRAGAQGDDWVINRSLRGTTLASELAARGEYREVAVPGVPDAPLPGRPAPIAAHTLGLCAALRPDVTFVHAAAADSDGHVIMSSPLSEGLWSALAARRGVIVTVERVVSSALTRAHAAAIALPPHRVLAICEEPFGAHPQPLHSAVELGIPSYRDDLEHYERWRAMTDDPDELAAFVDGVLRAPDPGAAYRAHVGARRLAALCEPEPVIAAAPVPEPALPAPEPHDPAVDQLIVAGARQLVTRARAVGARVLIAGLGQAFFAARMAQLQLAAAGYSLRVMVETGLYDVDCGAEGHGYLLAYDNVIRARRLSGIDDILGVLACGADNLCIAALGAAQVDRHGNLNSTRLAGRLLVGSGGACDIAASVEEVVVMTRLSPGRLVDDVEYITSTGRAVGSVVTERGVLTRPAPRDRASGSRGETWTIDSLIAADPEQTVELAVAALARNCPWPLVPAADLGFAPAITTDEARLLDTLDPTGTYRQRAG